MLDYTALEKKFLAVKLIDGTTVTIKPPKKKLFQKMLATEKKLKESEDYMSLYDDITSLVAEILSNNMTGQNFDCVYVDERMDLADMAQLMAAYIEYTRVIMSSPN